MIACTITSAAPPANTAVQFDGFVFEGDTVEATAVRDSAGEAEERADLPQRALDQARRAQAALDKRDRLSTASR